MFSIITPLFLIALEKNKHVFLKLFLFFSYQSVKSCFLIPERKIKTGGATVKPLITNTSKEFIKCRILHFLIMECCRYLVY